MTYQNVVIGIPLVPEWMLLSNDEEEFLKYDFKETLYTNERFLPRIMVDAGIVQSTSEVRRNKPELFRSLDELDCINLKWGKKRLYIVVGE